MDIGYRAFTLWPEWIYAVFNLKKDIENRDWALPRKHIGRRVLIHAGGNFDGKSKIPRPQYFTEVLRQGRAAGYEFSPKRESRFLNLLGYDVRSSDGKEVLPMVFSLLPRGALVGVATLTSSSMLYGGRSTYEDGSPVSAWSLAGMYGWRLDDVRAFQGPIPARGMMGIWKVKDSLIPAVEEQLELCGLTSSVEA